MSDPLAQQPYVVKLVELLKGPKNDKGGYDLNVVLVPDVQSNVGLDWAADAGEPWPGPFFKSVTEHIRIFEFTYNADLRSNFSWTTFLDLGGSFIDCIASSEQFDQSALLLVGHGLGGLIIKEVLVLLQDRLYNPVLARLNDLLFAAILLGTPHCKYGESTDEMDALLNSIQPLPKERLEKIREEFAVACALSLKFDGLTAGRLIWVLSETRPTKYSSQGLLKAKTKVIVDAASAATALGAGREIVVEVDADHQTVCRLKPNMALLNDIRGTLQAFLHNLEITSARTIEDERPSRRARQLFGSVTARTAPAGSAPGCDSDEISRNRSPALATAGSKDTTAYDVIPDPNSQGPVSYLPSVKLPCHILGPPSQECFGRDKVLGLLEEHLVPPQRHAKGISQLRSFALCGPGGVGKTTIARDFIKRHKQDFDAIFWVGSETEGKLSSAFNTIAAELGLLEPVDFGNSVISRNRLLDWLCNPLKQSRGMEEIEDLPTSLEPMANWLLVFDNADDLSILTEYWPINGVGSLLLTSRDPLAKSHMYSGDGINLEGFDNENAAAFLQHLARGKLQVNHDDVIHLADRIQGLPVLLVAITSMMEALGLSAPEFLEYYQERQFQSDIYKLKIGDSSENEQRSFFDILAFENFDVEALRLLEMLSLLDPDSIPEFLLITSKDDVQLPNRYPNTEESYKAARNYLERRSLISRDMDKQELTIHRVIQESVRARMSDKDFRETLQGAINLVTIAWAPTAGRWDYVMDRWSQCGLLFSHIETLRDEFLKCPDDYFSRDERLKAAKLLIEAGWYHFEKGNIEETIPFIDPTFNLIQNNNKESAQALSDAHFCLSSAYLWLRDMKKQQYHAQRCWELRKVLAPNGLDDLPPNGVSLPLCIAYDETARYHYDRRELETGLAITANSIKMNEIHEAGRGEPHEIEIGTYIGTWPRYTSALALYLLGRLDEAEAMIMSLYNRHEKYYGLLNTRIFKTGVSLSALSLIRAAQGRWDESFDLAQKTLQQYKQTIGNNHFYTASAHVKVGEHYTRLGDLDQASKHLEEASRIFAFRPCFAPDLARAQQKLSVVHGLLGNQLKAKGLQLKAQSLLRNFAREQGIPISGAFGSKDYERAVQFLLL